MFDGSSILWITAATSFAAALLTLLIPHAVGKIVTVECAAEKAGGAAQLRDGWKVLRRSRFLMGTTILSVSAVIVLAALQGLILPVYFTLVDRPGMLGFVLTALAAGSLIGGAFYAVTGRKGTRGLWFLVGIVGTTVGFAIIATLHSVWVVFVGAFAVGLANGVFASLIGVLMIERIPEQMRGRIMGTQNAVITAAPSTGIVAAAVLTELADVEVAALVLPTVWLLAIAVLARSLMRDLESEVGSTDDGMAVAGGA